MVFALSVLGGIAESADVGLQKSFERIREEIDSTAETQVKREEKAIDAVNKDTQEVMAKLRSAQAVLGGANDPKSAGRAAALLEQVGNVEDFDALIADIKQYKLNNEETYDFTKYFDSQQDIAGVNLAEVAQNYALGLRPPLAEIGEVERRGGGIGELFGVNVADRSRAKADAQLASLGLTMPKITEVALPSIAFKSEALKLDKMNPDQELTYLKEKLLDPDTDEGQLAFYQTRMTEISDKMGLDGKINNLTFQINMATADEKPALLKQLQTLNQEKASFDVLSTGNKVDIAKFELSEALANGDTAAANAARDKLVNMGEMSLKEVVAARIEQVQVDISRIDRDSPAGMSSQADLQRELEELQTLNQNIDTAMRSIEVVSTPTPAGVTAVMANVSKIVNQEIVNNPEFSRLGLVVQSNGSIDFPAGIDANTQQKINEFRAKREKAYLANMAAAMPKDGDVAFVANMLAQGYNSDDMDALAASADTVNAGTGQETDDLRPEEDDAAEVGENLTNMGVPESVQTRTDLSTEEKIMVAGVQNDYGSDLTERRLFDMMSDLHDENFVTLLSSKGVENAITEYVTGIYGPEVAAQYAQQIADYADAYAGFDDAAFNDYQDNPDSIEGQIVTVIRELEESNPDFSVEQIAPIVKKRFYEGDRSVDIPSIMTTVTKLITRHRATRPSEQGTITPKRQKKIDQVREVTGQETPRYSPEVVPPQDDTDEDVQVNTGESFEDKMKRLNPDAIYTQDPVEGLLSGSATFPPSEKQIPYRRIGDEFFRINDDGSLDRTPAGPLVTRELLDKLGPSGDLRPDEADESQDTTAKPEAKPLETEPSDASKVKGMTTVALASKFALGTMTADEAAELERRINNDPSGNVAMQVNEIAKRVQQQRAS